MAFGWFKKKPVKINAEKLSTTIGNIVGDYGEFLETNPNVLEIVDVKVLPHDKETILTALCVVITKQGGTEQEREHFISAALALAQFQKGVGEHPLHPLGVDITKFNINEMSPENLLALVAGNPSGKEQYDRFKPLVEADIKRIGERVHLANRAHREASH
ncbi:MAG: hypothetical protein EOQ98_04015 [Mesorhizobium sp.]|uniref:hypothetical protein n=1 Tax=Mesorhizobium sp. TaxID=1871066 RepID=UPI000FE5E8A5|nr:hypothetical protein [Mesorhizobium sp.]RWP02388.1 MAG: hypothetical protein EOQ98_04015 [Mesorhizobium sp.]TIM39065.1 MAG: hypothetical protein E5Y69_13175 [Mesorhizobium sp.]